MEILAVKYNSDRQTFEMARLEDDGLLTLFVVPDDILETRAAEYQIEPSEIDILMDIVLYEGEIEEPDDGLPLLFRTNVDEARQQHIARVLAHKQKIRPVPRNWRSIPERANILRERGVDQSWIDAITDDALAPIREHHRMDVEVLKEKALLVRLNVQRFQESRQRRQAASPSDRAIAYRQARERMMQADDEEEGV